MSLCHLKDVPKIKHLLSFSSVDQVFEKLRFPDNIGEKLPLLLYNSSYDILEAFKRIIVTKNEAQFKLLVEFVSKCSDSNLDWVFDQVQSILLTSFSWAPETAHMLNSFLKWRQSTQLSRNVLDANHFIFMQHYTTEERNKILERIEPDFRTTNFPVNKMENEKLKKLGFSAACWNQNDMLEMILKELEEKISWNDNFYDEILYFSVVFNDIDTMRVVNNSCLTNDSRILSLILNTAAFISPEMFLELVLSIGIHPEAFVMKTVDSETFTLYRLAGAVSYECFAQLLQLLSEDIKFSSFDLQDKKEKNILMWAVTNTEIFELILERSQKQRDAAKLIRQKDSSGWSCLRHACQVENMEVVKLLIENHSVNWLFDVDEENEDLYNFVQRVKLFSILEYLDHIKPWTICIHLQEEEDYPIAFFDADQP